MTGPNVFISYTHDSARHRDDVREFAGFLVSRGIAVELDQWAGVARQDWYPWAWRGMSGADYILVIASAGYREMGDGAGPNDQNHGGRVEAALLRDFLQRDRAQWTGKILPVVLPGHTVGEIPDFLQPSAADYYPVTSFTTSGAEGLLRAITGQAAHIRPPLGPRVSLPPRSGPGAGIPAPQPESERPRWVALPEVPPVGWLTDLFPQRRPQAPVLELHLVPAAPEVRYGVTELEAVTGELADVGRAQQIFPVTAGLRMGHSDRFAWAWTIEERSRETGLAVGRDGQRTCWLPLHPAAIGWIFDRDEIAGALAGRLSALLDIGLPSRCRMATATGSVANRRPRSRRPTSARRFVRSPRNSPRVSPWR
ncbi:SEFIR domain-containing protein [Amycolatopsis sp. GM8]|uniref:SEFIR domain-containing protein n=1 Tax=Amycolatopsis sp. GM8 TaxID=2896530 RepID=UPI001F00CC75|nr:SEFIR domain-containing protein [Amycolatopsis sp. GM8]